MLAAAPDWSVVLFIIGFVLIPFLISRFGGGAGSSPGDQEGVRAALPEGGIIPPDWVFAFVWVILYAAMGVSLWFAVSEPAMTHVNSSPHSKGVWAAGLAIFAASVAFNWAWVPVFGMGQDKEGAKSALWVLLAALVATATAAVLFLEVSVPAAAMLAPLIVWYVYALLLNIRVVERGGAGEAKIE